MLVHESVWPAGQPCSTCVRSPSTLYGAAVQEAIGDTDIKGAVEKKWRESVEQAFQNIKGKRLAQASQGVAQLLNDMTTQLTQQSSDSSVSTADLMRSLKASLASYVSTAEGPTKWPKLVEHLQTALAVIVKRVEGDAARGVDAAQRAASDLKAELATAQAEVARLRASAGSEESKARALESQLEAAHQKAATDADRVRKQLQVRKPRCPCVCCSNSVS